ncbi:right-handed parallel beta-helix repeat-containing protein [Natronobiforma cellulositropha]|uniref:right-handed parallel beta-helix repeat-containing protein n=1 Tax=Natronobiforma cellulositropha TaxID=1679076 RepID=UPI0021D5D201|nr:right-handed parallel beta-helix repeat-containing protein [Natronobiforma cellulositropha]
MILFAGTGGALAFSEGGHPSGADTLSANDVEPFDEEPTEVTTCREISTPGAYVLAGDLAPDEEGDLALDPEEHSDNACIAINASGVTLDGQGYTIDGTAVQDVDDFVGIEAQNRSVDAGYDDASELTGVTVRNVTVEEWHRGVRFHITRGATITDVTGTSEDVTEDRAIHLSHSHEATLEENHVEGTTYGMYLLDSDLGTVRNNTIDDVSLHGIGSSGDYTEIRDNELTNIGQSSSAAGVVLDSADHATIADNRFVGGGMGIETAYSADHPLIENNTFEGVESGTAMMIGEGTHGDITTDEGSRDATVRNNTVDDYTNGIRLYRQSTGAEIVDNTVSNVTNPGLVVTGGSDDAFIGNNSVTDSGLGLRLGSDDSEVVDNEFAGNAYGIELTRTDGSTIHHNTVTDSSGAGLDVFGTNEGTVVANNSFVDGGDGIEIRDNDGVSGVTIRHNDVSDNAGAGVRYDDLGSSDSEVGPHLLENDITNNAEEGIIDTYGVNVTYEGNYVANNGLEGFRLLEHAAESTIRGNTIVDNGHESFDGVAAIHIGDDWRGSPEAITVEDNVLSNNDDTGIVVEVTPDVVVRNNSLSGHALDVLLDRSSEVVLEENTFETGLDIAAEESTHYLHDVADNEFDDGSPLYYVRGDADPTVPADANQVIVVDADGLELAGGEYDTAPAPFGVLVAASGDATVEGLTITGDAEEGLRAEFLDESTIDGVSISGTDVGIALRHSTGTVIDGASITSVGDRATEEGFGILVEEGTAVEIRGGEVLDAGDNAIYVDGTDAPVVTNTTVDGAVQGVAVSDGPEAVVSGNDVSDLDRYGIFVDDATNATVANNSVTGATADAGSTWAALRVNDADGSVVSDNSLTGNGAAGLAVSRSVDAEILDNQIESNEIGLDTSGAGTSGPTNMIVAGNVIRDNTGDGVTDDGTREGGIGTLANNTISDNSGAGVFFDGTEGVTITGNDIERNGDAGISLDDAEDVTIRETVLDANGVGIVDDDSAGLVVEYSEITNSDGNGIDLDWTSGFELRNSTISGHDRWWSSAGLNGELSSSSVIADNVFESNQQAIELSEQRWFNDLVGVAIEVRGNDFVSNDGGVTVDAEADEVAIVENSFESTTGLAVEYAVTDPAHSLNATNNWWGDASGPSGGVEDPVTGTSADGSGDDVGENVLFDPWLTSEPDDDEPGDEPEADLSLVDASVSETDVVEGDDVTITADVENAGDAAGEYTAALEIDGSGVATETVSVDAGETESVSFTHAFDTAGAYDVTVDGVEAGTVSVTEPTGGLVIQVTDEDTGDGIEMAYEIWDGDTLIEDGETDDNGATFLASVPVGTYDVDLSAPGYEPKTVEAVEIEPDEDTNLYVDLTPLPELSVVDASLSDDEVAVGENVRITATVENSFESAETYEATLEIDGAPVANETVSVDANTTATVAFTHGFDDGGLFDVTVDGVAAGTVTVDDPALEVTDASVSTDEAAVGEDVTITATVENSGVETGSHVTTLGVNGTAVATETVEVAANGSMEVEFTHAFDEGGVFDVTVDGVDANTVTAVYTTGGVVLSVTDAVSGDGTEATFEIRDGTETVRHGVTSEDGHTLEVGLDIGTYEVDVSTPGYETNTTADVEIEGGENTDVTVELTPVAVLSITDVSLSDDEVDEGEEVTITAEVENAGAAAGNLTAALEIDGTAVTNGTVAADPGETETIGFTHAFDDTGDYDVTVDGVEAGTVSVIEPSTGSPPSGPSPSPSPSPPPSDPDPETEVSVDESDGGVTAVVTAAEATEPTSIPFGDELGDEATLSTVTLTTVDDADFDVTIQTTDGTPADANQLPNEPAELLTMEIDASLEADEIDAATLEFHVSGDELATHDLDAGDVTLYHLVDGEWTERNTDLDDQFPGSSWDSQDLNDLFPGSTWEDAEEPSDLFPGSSWDSQDLNDLFPGSTWEEADEPSDLFPGSSWEDAEEPSDLFPGSSWDSQDLNDLFPGSTWEDAEEPSDLFPGSSWEGAEEPSDLFPGSSWDETDAHERQSDAYYSAQTPHFSAFALVGHQSDLAVVDHSVSQTGLSVGESVTVEATVRNDGGATGNYEVGLEVDDVVEATESVSVEPGAETEVSISHTFETAGEYTLAVDGIDAGTAIVEDSTDAGTVPDEPDPSDDGADDDGLPGFGAMVALLALASVVVVARLR